MLIWSRHLWLRKVKQPLCYCLLFYSGTYGSTESYNLCSIFKHGRHRVCVIITVASQQGELLINWCHNQLTLSFHVYRQFMSENRARSSSVSIPHSLTSPSLTNKMQKRHKKIKQRYDKILKKKTLRNRMSTKQMSVSSNSCIIRSVDIHWISMNQKTKHWKTAYSFFHLKWR